MKKLLIILFTLYSLESIAQEYYVNTNLLYVREEPNTTSRVVNTLSYLMDVSIDPEANFGRDEMLEVNGKLTYGKWVKVHHLSINGGLLMDNNIQIQNPKSEGYIFDAFISPTIDRDAIEYNVITQEEYNRLKAKAPKPIPAPKSIKNLNEIVQLLSDNIVNPKIEGNDKDGFILFDAIKLHNGHVLNNQGDLVIAAYIQEEEIIELAGGHEVEYFVNLKTGVHSELIGDPIESVISPDRQYRVSRLYQHQEPGWSLEKKVNGDYKLITKIPLWFYEYTWLDNQTLIMLKWEDYGNEYKYIKAKILK